MASSLISTSLLSICVCVVGELPPPTGGMAVQALQLSKRLHDEGHQVLNVRTNMLTYNSILCRIRGVRGVFNFILFLGSLVPTVRRTDCLHIFSNSYLSFFLFTMPAVTVGRWWRKRIVLHYHGGSAGEFLDRWFWAVQRTLRSVDALLVPSSFLTKVFARYGLSTIEIPNILALDEFHFRQRTPLHPRVLIARHLTPPYNVACGLRAFAILCTAFSNATLIIAGDGSERQALMALSRKLGIADAVTFTGNVDSAQMRLLYDQSDLFLNTSRVDNQPVSILEAFACGLPVVTTAVGGIPFMTTHGRDALLAPDDDAEALAQHLITLLTNPKLASALVEQGQRRVEDYRWEKIYPRLAAIYRGEAI